MGCHYHCLIPHNSCCIRYIVISPPHTLIVACWFSDVMSVPRPHFRIQSFNQFCLKQYAIISWISVSVISCRKLFGCASIPWKIAFHNIWRWFHLPTVTIFKSNPILSTLCKQNLQSMTRCIHNITSKTIPAQQSERLISWGDSIKPGRNYRPLSWHHRHYSLYQITSSLSNKWLLLNNIAPCRCTFKSARLSLAN